MKRNLSNMKERKKFDKESVKKVIHQAVEESDSTVEEIEEVTRISKYVEEGNRPIKVRFKSQIVAETILFNAWKLSKRMTINRYG